MLTTRTALCQEIPADHLTPIAVYAALAGKGSCILESAPGTGQGKYSYIGIDPTASLKTKGRRIELTIEGRREIYEGDPFEALKRMQAELKTEVDVPCAGYTGGLVGFVAYDAVRQIEKIPDRHPDVLAIPDLFFQYYRSSVSFDHEANRAFVCVADGDEAELKRLLERLSQVESLPILPKREGSRAECDLSDGEYGKLVEKAKEHIRAGDIFQMVPSRTFRVKTGADPFQIYRSLRQTSPAPYLFFFDLEGMAVAGASPEKLISVQNGIVESSPIAGTRPKGGSAEELLNDPKEVAEHVMLVDLARNDLGAVCVPGTVQVADYLKVHAFSHVIHIVSRVVGKLDPKFDAIDAFRASFPAGTLTGAPKVRAMELIDEIEQSRRGLYGGAVVAIDAEGNLMSCIAIRTALIREGEAQVRAGGGVVFDSDPLIEAAETRHKASTVLEALRNV